MRIVTFNVQDLRLRRLQGRVRFDGARDYDIHATRTARDMLIEHPFMRNNPMTRAARQYFNDLRKEVRTRAPKASARTAKPSSKPLPKLSFFSE